MYLTPNSHVGFMTLLLLGGMSTVSSRDQGVEGSRGPSPSQLYSSKVLVVHRQNVVVRDISDQILAAGQDVAAGFASQIEV